MEEGDGDGKKQELEENGSREGQTIALLNRRPLFTDQRPDIGHAGGTSDRDGGGWMHDPDRGWICVPWHRHWTRTNDGS